MSLSYFFLSVHIKILFMYLFKVCFTATLDAIFSSTCYRIFTQQVRETEVGGLPAFESVLTADTYHYVRDNDTSTKFTMEEIINGKALHNYQNDGWVSL